MSKISLNSISDLTQSTTAANTINTNNSVIQTAFDNTLSRDGTSPNQMLSNLDMNSNQIINLTAPLSANSPLRLQDANTLNGGGTIQSIPSGGTTGQILSKTSNTSYAVNWITAAVNTVTLIPPLGRLTLATATPVMTSSQAGRTTVYYTPFAGGMCPIYNGTSFTPTTFAELSQATTDAGKSPAAVVANSVYDAIEIWIIPLKYSQFRWYLWPGYWRALPWPWK